MHDSRQSALRWASGLRGTALEDTYISIYLSCSVSGTIDQPPSNDAVPSGWRPQRDSGMLQPQAASR